MIPLLSTVARTVARRLPRSLVEAVKTRLFDPVAYQRAAGEAVARSIVGEALDQDGEGSIVGGPTIGILMDADFYFCYNIAACLARGLRYRRVRLDDPILPIPIHAALFFCRKTAELPTLSGKGGGMRGEPRRRTASDFGIAGGSLSLSLRV